MAPAGMARAHQGNSARARLQSALADASVSDNLPAYNFNNYEGEDSDEDINPHVDTFGRLIVSDLPDRRVPTIQEYSQSEFIREPSVYSDSQGTVDYPSDDSFDLQSTSDRSDVYSPSEIMAASNPMAYLVIPSNQWRYVRACMACSILLPQSVFRAEGCPNCPFLELKGSPENIEACTSSQYEGSSAIFDPNRSWIARWQRVDPYVPANYAIKVNGSLPDDVRQTLEEQGHTLIP